MKIRKIFGNPFGEFLLILAEVLGLVGNIFLGIQCVLLAGVENLGKLFESNALLAAYAYGTIVLPVIFLLVAFIGTIVGLAKKKRALGVMSVIFIIAAILCQAAPFVLGFGGLDNFSIDINTLFTNGGLMLIVVGHLALALGLIFALIAVICVGAKKRPGAIVFGILSFPFFLMFIYAYVFPVFAQSIGEPFFLLNYFAEASNTTIQEIPMPMVILLLCRGAYIFVFGLALFICVFARLKAKGEAKIEEPAHVEETIEPHVVEEKKEDVKGDHIADITHSKDRIIIEIR